MSSRNSFTTSYIYHKEAVEYLADQMALMGYGIQPSGGQHNTQVVGMIKNVEFSKEKLDKVKKLLKETKEKFDIKYALSIVFIGDTYPVVTFLTTDPDENFRLSWHSDIDN